MRLGKDDFYNLVYKDNLTKSKIHERIESKLKLFNERVKKLIKSTSDYKNFYFDTKNIIRMDQFKSSDKFSANIGIDDIKLIKYF